MLVKLQDETVLFLGSSVTYGSLSGGVSFADYMARQCDIHMIKEAVPGTTLSDVDDQSYVARLKRVERTLPVGLFICQLSTNDAARNLPLNKIEEAIRFIYGFVDATWHCPQVFFTNTQFNYPFASHYVSMMDLLQKLQKELSFAVLNLWNDSDMLSVNSKDYARYMADQVHPTGEGYEHWWTPKFVDFCTRLP